MPVDNELKGRLALITGASGGIGGACARDLARHGVHLALTYSKNKESVDVLIKELRAIDPSLLRISSHQVDMVSATQIQHLFEEIEQQHNTLPDILVSNAGHGKRIPDIVDISLEEFDFTLSVNLRSSFILTKACVPHMRSQRWGRIILMSSIAARGGGVNGCHYAASKAGLEGLGKNLARKLAGEGITVNCVAPAMIGETRMIPNAEYLNGTPGDVRNIPVGRLGTPDETAQVVTMFIKTGYATGQTCLLAGGLL
ncbi:3-oxoacyl-reductase [Cadophora sp. DSE1049]|nr:3-oxoacyl-reductase [Cadophora sp. DSE1049]